jgi:Fic family protein
MVSIVTKKIKGNEYLYLVTSVRDGPKVKQKFVKYIGKKRPISKDEFNCMKYSYSNKDWILTEFRDYLSYQDHNKMEVASKQHYFHLKTLDELSKEKEKEKFYSAFIADSNAIEGSTLTSKETFDYLFNDIVPQGHKKKELYMATNLFNALKYVEEHYNSDINQKDLFELHRLVNQNIESEKTLGGYKKVQNYIGDVNTSSYLFVKERMEKLFDWITEANSKINAFEVAFQSHAQFETIHPFVDGNGRVGRLMLNWILMSKGFAPLIIRDKRRSEYVSALKNSQNGKVEAICNFCLKEYLDFYKFL